MQVDLNGHAALVTGAGSGIGRAIALTLAGSGAAVAVADLHGDRADVVGEEIARAGGAALALAGDVSRREDCLGWVEASAERFGRLDILVNNAGMQFVAPVQEYPEEQWDRLL